MNFVDWASLQDKLTSTAIQSLADQASPVRRTCRGAKHRAAGTGLQPVPWRASEARRRQGWKPKGARRHRWLDAQHDSATRHRPGDARKSVEPAMRLYSKPQKYKTTFTHLRKPTEPCIRKRSFVFMRKSGFTHPRQAVHPQTRQ
ncbi:hypothetical protein [Ramlibacter sp. 2FC]|uniref:hypothetical protein n=1 Tax=Ramlibacter sp. 2FC TaxID=2502188 RepID=UPI0014854316|nr:hypothetical protein [Ramlibacter sp. 2FC]